MPVRAYAPGAIDVEDREQERPFKQDLLFIKALLETGSETAEALRYLEKGHTRGNVIITRA